MLRYIIVHRDSMRALEDRITSYVNDDDGQLVGGPFFANGEYCQGLFYHDRHKPSDRLWAIDMETKGGVSESSGA